MTVAWHGKRAGDAVRASVRRRAAGYAGNLHAKVVDHPADDGRDYDTRIRIRGAASEADRADGGGVGGGGGDVGVDDTAAVRVRGEFSDLEVPAGAEQDDGDVGDSGGGFGSTRLLQLAADAEAGVGPGGRRRGLERHVVVRCGGSAGLYIHGELWASLVWFLVEGVSESLGFCQTLAGFRCHALVSPSLSLSQFKLIFRQITTLVA